MTRTEDLIETLVASSGPVRPLAPPLTRAALWLAMTVGAIAVTIAVDGLCPNLARRLADPLYRTSLGAAGLTGACAAIGAFFFSLPDRSRFWAMTPLVPALVWIGTVAASCFWRDPLAPATSLTSAEALHCTAVFAIVSLVPCGILFRMLRAAPLAQEAGTRWLGALAIGGLATLGFSLTRYFEEPIMILVWNLGAAGLTTAGIAAWYRRPTAFARRTPP